MVGPSGLRASKTRWLRSFTALRMTMLLLFDSSTSLRRLNSDADREIGVPGKSRMDA
jgi:hypothetical protein